MRRYYAGPVLLWSCSVHPPEVVHASSTPAVQSDDHIVPLLGMKQGGCFTS